MSEKERVWMQFNVGDYVRDTRHLSTLEHGAYFLLIMRYWEDGGLPDNEILLARYAGLTAEQWAQSRDVLAAFFHDGWRHRRIDDEIAKAAAKIEQRKNARRGDGSVTEGRRKRDGRPTDDPRPRVEETITESSSLRSEDSAPAKPTPRSELETVLDTEHARAVIEHRQRLRKPLTARAATLLAQTLARHPNPNAAADEMIERGWQTIKPGWGEDNRARAGPAPSKDSVANAARRRLEAEIGRADESGIDDHQQAVGLLSGNSLRLVG